MTFNKVFFAIAILFSVVLLSCKKNSNNHCACVDISQEPNSENSYVTDKGETIFYFDTIKNVKGTNENSACLKLQKEKSNKVKGVDNYLCKPVKLK